MRPEIVVRPEAAGDAMQAAHWYEQRLGGLGGRFLAELDAIITAISELPARYPLHHGDIRRARLKSFPYAAFYVVHESRIILLGVLHLQRDPRLIRRTLRQR
jgi:plasmid stabilization system protein ParE